ncbi:MAG: signal peptide peptidase SppA [Succinivibrio sp.]|nr:signal peptide peptidase SppA [Succinivibrio sp.]
MSDHNFSQQPSAPNPTHSTCHTIWRGLCLVGSILTFTRNLVLNLLFLVVLLLLVAVLCKSADVQERARDWAMGTPSQPSRSQVVYFDLGGFISELPFSYDDLSIIKRRIDREFSGQRVHELVSIEEALNAAAQDPNIKEIVINLEDADLPSLSAAQRLGRALDQCRENGKKVAAFASWYTQASYLIAAHASEISLDPLGEIELRGVGLSSLYFKSLLDEFKLTPYVFRAGSHKSAVEPLLRDDMSPEIREEYQSLASGLWQLYTDEISRSRSKITLPLLTPLQELLGGLKAVHGDMAQYQHSRHLVDKLQTQEEFFASYIKTYGRSREDEFMPNFVAYDDYLWFSEDKKDPPEKGCLAVIYGEDEILDSADRPYAFTPGKLIPLIEEVASDDDYKGLVLFLNSGGGSTYASELIRRALFKVKAKGKPVVVSMNDTAASGAYWVATAADKILATPDTITGSVGVFGVGLGVHGLLNEHGVHEDGAVTHELAENDLARPLPAQVGELLQLEVDSTYDKFVDLVCTARKLRRSDARSFAEGRVFLAEEAYKLGLIDGIGDLNDALKSVAELSGLTLEHAPVIHLTPEDHGNFSFFDNFTAHAASTWLPVPLLEKWLQARELLQSTAPAGRITRGIMALTPLRRSDVYRHAQVR